MFFGGKQCVYQSERLQCFINKMQKGKTFETADHAIKFMKDFSDANYHPMRQRNCVSIAAYNKKVSTMHTVFIGIRRVCAVLLLTFRLVYCVDVHNLCSCL